MTYSVFVSSTYLDNVDRRKIVMEAINDAGMIPIAMERFGAAEEQVVDYCLGKVREADILVGIIAHKYGWQPDGSEKSITELEYQAAKDLPIPRLMFVIDPKLPFTVEDCDPGPERWDKQKKLEAFIGLFTKDQTPAVFTEHDLGKKVYKSLLEWKAKKKGKKRPPKKEPNIELEIKRYLEKAESLHATLPLTGFSTKLRVPLDVEEIYVPLRAMADLRAVGKAVFADAEEAERSIECGREASELSLPDAFKAYAGLNRRGFVILGDPGAGKTTHLKRVVVACCRQGPAQLGLPKGMVPVFLPLRDLRDPNAGLAGFIQSQLDKNKELGTDKDFGKRLLERKNLLLLLDGLDEVFVEAHRRQVARWIETALTSHPECRFVVTCRYAGYNEAVRLDEHFLELHIRPLTEAQVETFVHNWYRIVEQGLSKDKVQAKAVAEKKARKLVQRLRAPDFQARRVYELTANPLLLANICLVHRDRGELPKRRAQLYSECVDVLLERWRADLPIQVTADEARRVL